MLSSLRIDFTFPRWYQQRAKSKHSWIPVLFSHLLSEADWVELSIWIIQETVPSADISSENDQGFAREPEEPPPAWDPFRFSYVECIQEVSRERLESYSATRAGISAVRGLHVMGSTVIWKGWRSPLLQNKIKFRNIHIVVLLFPSTIFFLQAGNITTWE